jgi:hypothetical protein
MAIIPGRYYKLTYTLSWTSGTNIGTYINGTFGNSGTMIDYIGPVGASGGLVFTPTTNAQCAISNISVIETTSSFYPISFVMNDSIASGSLYTGGNVSPLTKHIINSGVVSPTAVAVPGVLMLCDFLLAYPLIDANTTSPQTLTTTNALSRYTNGIGVKPFIVATSTLGATVVPSLTISYTNQAGTPGQVMPGIVAVNNPASSIAGTIIHSAAAVNSTGPFLPLAAGDTGVRSVETVTFGTATGTASTCCLVLVKPLWYIPITTTGVMSEEDMFDQLPSMPQVTDGAYLGWLYYACAATTVSTPFYGCLDICYG